MNDIFNTDVPLKKETPAVAKHVLQEVRSINVVSLFNGMGTLRQAFHNLGIKVNNYYSSEIKTYAIKLQQHHFPDVIQVGDIRNWREWDIDWSSIDFIGSGSPCQDLSSIGKGAGLNGDKSSLFFTFVEILNYCKSLNPNVKFLQENVGSASKKDIGIMSRALGVYPARINSSLLTAHLRDRYYWTNIRTKDSMFDIITDIPEPKDKKILLQDVLTDGFTKREKAQTLLERRSFCYTDEFSENAQRFLRTREKFGVIVIHLDNGLMRTVNKTEMCRLQGFPDDYCDILNEDKTQSLLGDGWTLPMIEHILSFYAVP
jgi:site-specific DNA-cytosine methylase